MLEKQWSLNIVPRKGALEVMSSKTRRLDADKKPYIDTEPTLFIKSDEFTGEAIAFDDNNAVIFTFAWVEGKEEEKA